MKLASTIPISRPLLGKEELAAAQAVLKSGQVAAGPRVAEFEQAFAEYCGAKFGIATNNGTSALHATLASLGLEPGSEVIVPAFTFVATANAVVLAGLRPVLADIDPRTYTLDPDAVAKLAARQTKAVLPVHLYGHSADMDALREVASEKDLVVVADCAQAHGAMYGGRRVGAVGDVGCFSFYATKNMTTGEGGMVTTNLPDLAEDVRSFVNHGRAKGTALGTYDHVRLGTNMRLTDLQAAIGLEQLAKLDSMNERRAHIAARYTKRFRELGVALPEARLGTTHVYHQYTLRVKDRDRFVAALKESGVGTGIYYPKALHQYEHLSGLRHGAVKESERAAREVVSLPVHPGLADEEVERVMLAVEKALAP